MAAIEFVNHAGYFLENDKVGILHDFWVEGPSFNNGWDLISKWNPPAGFYDRVTHLWVSHEHPDHFSPRSIRLVPEHKRKRITALFQTTRDKKVVRFFAGQGFTAKEIPEDRWLQLAEGVRVKCKPHRHIDSWLLTEVDGVKILNINDCEINTKLQAHRLYRHVGDVDVLLTQFSYANWIGNPPDKAERERIARRKLAAMANQAEVFSPKYVIPFASFVYFSHEENNYLNDSMNTIRTAYDHLKNAGSEVVVLYPNERWEIGQKHDSEASIRKYEKDYATVPERPLRKPEKVELSKIFKTCESFVARLKRINDSYTIELLYASGFLKPLKIRLWDYDECFELHLLKGLRKIPNQPCDIEMSSDSLNYCFSADWGGETLYVNGRFRTATGSKEWLRNFYVSILNNRGYAFVSGSVMFLVKELFAWMPPSAVSMIKQKAAAGLATKGRKT